MSAKLSSKLKFKLKESNSFTVNHEDKFYF